MKVSNFSLLIVIVQCIYRYSTGYPVRVSVGGLTTPKLVVLVAFRWFWCELQTGEPLLVWK